MEHFLKVTVEGSEAGVRSLMRCLLAGGDSFSGSELSSSIGVGFLA